VLTHHHHPLLLSQVNHNGKPVKVKTHVKAGDVVKVCVVLLRPVWLAGWLAGWRVRCVSSAFVEPTANSLTHAPPPTHHHPTR
jgi:hypothetical protein